MTKPKKPPPDDPEQSRRFMEAARELEADESGRKFTATVSPQVLNTKNPPPAEPKAGKRSKAV